MYQYHSYLFKDIVIGEEGLLKGPFGSDLKKELYVPKGENTYKVYLQENILKERNDVGPHYISKKYYDEKMSRYAVKENDFIVTCDGTLGEIYQLKNLTEQGIISSSLLRITLNNNIVDENYFYYLFKSQIKNRLIRQGNNSVLKHLPGLGVIRQQKIELPDLKIQRKIGETLKSLDDKIKNNNKINFELESMAKTIYDYWFLQFEFPNEEGKPYKSSGGKMIWNEELKREIPEGWEVKPLGEISTLYQPNTITEKDLDNNGKYIVYGANGVIGKYNQYNHKENEIAVCCRGASCGKFLMTQPYSWITGNSMVVSPNSFVSKEYIYYSLSYKRISPFITGTAQPQITRTNFEKMKIIVAKNEIINKFEIFATEIRKKLLNNQKQNQELASLRDFLLPLLINGQITIRGC